MFFRKATDGEARAWLARKQVIAWGIINELSLEIERLDAELAKSDADHQNLTVTLNKTKQLHESVVQDLQGTFKEQINEVEEKGGNESADITARFEK